VLLYRSFNVSAARQSSNAPWGGVRRSEAQWDGVRWGEVGWALLLRREPCSEAEAAVCSWRWRPHTALAPACWHAGTLAWHLSGLLAVVPLACCPSHAPVRWLLLPMWCGAAAVALSTTRVLKSSQYSRGINEYHSRVIKSNQWQSDQLLSPSRPRRCPSTLTCPTWCWRVPPC